MKLINNLVITTLGIMVVGFFANFAQNEYGMDMVVLCCVLLSILFYIKTYYLIKHKRYFNILLAFSLLCGFMQIFSLGSHGADGIASGDVSVFVFIGAFSIFIFVPMIIVPLSLAIMERKINTKTLTVEYFANLFPAMFCLAIYMKNQSLAGAGIIMVLSGLIIIPFFISFLKYVIFAIKEKKTTQLLSGFSYLFLSCTLVAFVLKTQHWPGANLLLYGTFTLYGLILVIILYAYFFKKNLAPFWDNKSFTFKTLFITFSVTTVYVNLMRNEIAPEIYSNYRPKALQELISKANDFTTEGRINKKKVETYTSQYEDFLVNQRHGK